MPYSLSQKMNGKAALNLTLETIEVNTSMDDTIFQMPEKPKEEKKDAGKQ
jgi:hypothetical protein